MVLLVQPVNAKLKAAAEAAAAAQASTSKKVGEWVGGRVMLLRPRMLLPPPQLWLPLRLLPLCCCRGSPKVCA